MLRKKWCVKPIDKEIASDIAERHNFSAIRCLVLASKGIVTDEQIEEFFSQASQSELSNPFDFIDMETASQRVIDAIAQDEKIAIYGDYDVDGITATSILKIYLEAETGKEILAYIPSRDEGYGLNFDAIRSLKEQGVQLIITVDNGITAIAEADLIAELGMDLVVTDHHTVGDTLPKAVAVVNPHRSDCPSEFKDICGAMIAFMLVSAIECDDHSYAVNEFAEFAALATVADLMPLVSQNRNIVKLGLNNINVNQNEYMEKNLGMYLLRNACFDEKETMIASDLAFKIAPKINAVGRVDNANRVVELFTGKNNDEKTIESILEFNTIRKEIENNIVQDIEKMIENSPKIVLDDIIILAKEGWHTGVIGIVCAKIVEKYGKPCMIISIENGEGRASARSIEGFSIYNAINSSSELLTHFGGHFMAAGFSLHESDIAQFKQNMKAYTKKVAVPFAKQNVDLKVISSALSYDEIVEMEKFEPFGNGNQEVVFGLFDMTIDSIQSIGKDKNHLRLTLSKKINGKSEQITVLKFFLEERTFAYECGDVVDLAITSKSGEFRGKKQVSHIMQGLRMSKTDDELYLKSHRVYEKIKRGEKPSSETAKKVLPSRDDIAKVFRFFKVKKEFPDSFDVLCYRLGDDGSGAAKFLFAIEVLVELELLYKKDEKIYYANSDKKVDLGNSKVLKYLNSLI